eukprot:4176815-Amphidinium_carterae.1
MEATPVTLGLRRPVGVQELRAIKRRKLEAEQAEANSKKFTPAEPKSASGAKGSGKGDKNKDKTKPPEGDNIDAGADDKKKKKKKKAEDEYTTSDDWPRNDVRLSE